MSDRPFAYVCSPLRGDIEANMERAQEYSRQVFEAGYCPITPHIYFPQFLNDNITEEREAGMKMGEPLLPFCRVLVVCGTELSEGMKREIGIAERLNLAILTLDAFLPENAKECPPATTVAFIGEINKIRMVEKSRDSPFGDNSVLSRITADREKRAANKSGRTAPLEKPKSRREEL